MAGNLVVGQLTADAWKNADGSENFKCRAWVNFNGTGTLYIRAGGNVSSVTDNGVGNYTLNFARALPDANYCAVFGQGPGANPAANVENDTDTFIGLHTAATLDIHIETQADVAYDVEYISVAIFR